MEFKLVATDAIIFSRLLSLSGNLKNPFKTHFGISAGRRLRLQMHWFEVGSHSSFSALFQSLRCGESCLSPTAIQSCFPCLKPPYGWLAVANRLRSSLESWWEELAAFFPLPLSLETQTAFCVPGCAAVYASELSWCRSSSPHVLSPSFVSVSSTGWAEALDSSSSSSEIICLTLCPWRTCSPPSQLWALHTDFKEGFTYCFMDMNVCHVCICYLQWPGQDDRSPWS